LLLSELVFDHRIEQQFFTRNGITGKQLFLLGEELQDESKPCLNVFRTRNQVQTFLMKN
jgi:hypothetical protein